MTVTSVKTGADPGVLKLGLSDGSLFFIRLSYLPSHLADVGLFLVGSDFSDGDVAELRASSGAFRVERAALRLISGREHSIQALSLKLRQKGHPDTLIPRVIDFLCSRSLLDDSRYARLWLESRIAHHPEGRQKLLRGLIAHGVGEVEAQRSLGAVLTEEVELDLLRQFLAWKRLSPNPGDPALKKVLYAAGFRPTLLRRLVEES